MPFSRFAENPLIEPAHVKPSRPDAEVLCAFNPAVTAYEDQILLLVRVAERPIQEPGFVSTYVMNFDSGEAEVEIVRFRLGDPNLIFSDPRYFYYDEKFYLTSLSHLRIARSDDGRHFQVEDGPCLAPSNLDEEYGIEDARITRLGDTYWINATSVSRRGIPTSLYSTHDFRTFVRHGVIFPPDNRNVTIFPEKIAGQYFALHRPLSKFSQSSIWTARSDDLLHWGEYTFLIGPRRGKWDGDHIGGGAVPIKTDQGYLEIYHGADENGRYCLGLVLLDLDDPRKVLLRRDRPIFEPQEPYERQGFVNEIVFTCGIVERGDSIFMYYGAGDTTVAGAEVKTQTLLEHL